MDETNVNLYCRARKERAPADQRAAVALPGSKGPNVNVIIDKHPVSMQIDTDASCTVISSKIWSKMGEPKLSRCYKTLEAYDGRTMRSLGKFTTIVEKDDKYMPVNIIVIDSKKFRFAWTLTRCIPFKPLMLQYFSRS